MRIDYEYFNVSGTAFASPIRLNGEKVLSKVSPPKGAKPITREEYLALKSLPQTTLVQEIMELRKGR